MHSKIRRTNSAPVYAQKCSFGAYQAVIGAVSFYFAQLLT